MMKSVLSIGERRETINVHSITNLEEQVKCLGPLWTHSAFAFEAMIAHTLKGFKGTRGVAEQVHNSNNHSIQDKFYIINVLNKVIFVVTYFSISLFLLILQLCRW